MKTIPQFIIAVLLATSLIAHAEDDCRRVDFKLTFDCPPSSFREEVVNAIPPIGYQAPDKEAWIEKTIEQIDALAALIKSGEFQEARVDFEANIPGALDLNQLPVATCQIDITSLRCEELTALQTLLNNTKDNLPYNDWASSTLEGIHLFQSLLYKKALSPTGSTSFKPLTNLSDNEPIPLNMSFKIIGPHSTKIEAVKKAIIKYEQPHKNYDEWAQALFDLTNKLELLIFSRQITSVNSDIDIADN